MSSFGAHEKNKKVSDKIEPGKNEVKIKAPKNILSFPTSKNKKKRRDKKVVFKQIQQKMSSMSRPSNVFGQGMQLGGDIMVFF